METQKAGPPTLLKAVCFYLCIGMVLNVTTAIMFGTSIRQTAFWSFVSWTAVYFFFLFKYFWVLPEEKTALIVQDYLMKPKVVTGTVDRVSPLGVVPEGQFTIIRISPLWPWQQVIGKIKLVTTIYEIPMTKQDLGGINVNLKVRVAIAPTVDENLPLALTAKDETQLVKWYGSLLEPEIEKAVSGANVDDIRTNLPSFNDKLEEVFSGSGIDAKKERVFGYHLVSMVVSSAEKEPTAQEADEIARTADKLIKVVRQINDALGDDSASKQIVFNTILRGKNPVRTDNVTVRGAR